MSKIYVNDPIQILKGKDKPNGDEGKLYIQVTKDQETFQNFLKNLEPGATIWLNNKEEERERQVSEGKLTEDRAMELAEKIGFIKYGTTLVVEK